jgi:hypothetical protein
LEGHKDEGGYSLSDVGIAINYFLENKFNLEPAKGGEKEIARDVTPVEIRKVYKDTSIFESGNLEPSQEKFLIFLVQNQDKSYGTVDIYKSLGLSSRKGNEIKKVLLDKNLIRVEERKNEKGWKKIIKLSVPVEAQVNSY